MMTNPVQNKHILLGVTGSIACYKAVDLASRLTQAGAHVDVLLTQSAEKFVSPLTFQSVTGRKAYTDVDLWAGEAHIVHVGLGHRADLFVIAPCSANTLAKLAHGIADNTLTVAALAADCTLLIAPAMDAGMFSHPATQANVEILRQRGDVILGPAEGRMASGLVGIGRMVEPAEILGNIRRIMGLGGPLADKRVVVTAGGTQEPIDPVRVIANRSSGKQGFALAQAALDLGARVTLISAPAMLDTPAGAERVEVGTAQEMLDAVMHALPEADVLLMAAAVADFRPAQAAREKIKKTGASGEGVSGLELSLENTVDILAQVAEQKAQTGFPRVTVGFAAESQDLVENARSKLQAKNLDMIVANDILAADAGFSVDTNRVVLLEPHQEPRVMPLMGKDQVAAVVLDRVVALLAKLS
jgi:phosphopantothenoylcysteine decarboxylase / phosphopantothenate---cysteine ligase